MGSPKPSATRAPYEGTTTNTYGYQSQDPNNQYVQRFLNTPIETDPGVARRGDLAEQQMENQWNSAFASGIPEHIRMMNMDAGRRALRSEQAAQGQQAEYQKNQLELQRSGALLPQLVQTGGSQQGYNTQIGPAQQGFWGQFLGGLAGGLGSAATGGFI